jgi:hypothetical protein
MKRTVPIITAFLSGLALIISFFFNPEETFLGQIQEVVLQWMTIIGGFALVLGVHSIVKVNLARVKRKAEDWPFKLATVISVLAMALPAMLPSSWSSLFGNGTGSIYDWLFEYIDSPMMETMFAMLAFYIASAAYRAFRARNTEATLLLLTAVLVMLWRVPMGEAFLRLFGERVPEYINMFVMNGFNVSVQRGIIIGAALGAAAMSLRIILGIERTYMGKG